MSMAQSAYRSELRHIVLMGVSGSGKSSFGAELSRLTRLRYLDGDDLHPPGNVEKMRAGQALTDDDRWPWLDLCGQALRDAPKGLIIGCSALRRVHRDRLRAESGQEGLAFVHLTGPERLLQARMEARSGHYMPARLLESQLNTLELPDADENAVTVNISQPVGAIASDIVAAMNLSRAEETKEE